MTIKKNIIKLADFKKNNPDQAINLFLAACGVILAALALSSLRWRLQVDVPVFHYVAMLMDRYGYMPYRDIYDYGMPGTYFLHWFILKTVGYSDLGLRFFDLTWLAAFMYVTYLIMRDFSARVGVAAALLTGIMYLAKGGEASLERDFLLLLPLALAILSYRTPKITKPLWRYLICGFWLGAAASMKPHAALALLAFIPDYDRETGLFSKTTILKILWLGLGLCILPAISIIWIWSNGAWPYFWEIFTNYVPLYNELNRNLVILHGGEKLDDALGALNNLYPIGLLLAPAVVGIFPYLTAPVKQKSLTCLLISLFGFALMYLVIPNKFYAYHWLPLIYFTYLLVALSFGATGKTAKFVYTLAILVLSLQLLYGALTYVFLPTSDPLLKEVDRIGAYLQENLQSGEKVQSLGWVGYALHGMYAGRAPLATRYLLISVFTHHLDNPYVQHLRADFLNQLNTTPPAYFVYGKLEFEAQGSDLTQIFPALATFIQNNYQPVLQGQSFIIYKRL